MIKKIFLIVLSLVLVLSFKKKTTDQDIVIYLPKTLSSIPILELNQSKIRGKNIRTEFFQDHIMAMSEFITGKADLLMTGFSQGAAHYQNNPDIIHLATPVWGVSSLITHDQTLQKLSDFKGKKIAVPFSKSPLDLQLRAILAKNKLSDQISIEYAVPQQAVAMLLSKKIAGVCVPEPLVSKLVMAQKAYIAFYFPDQWGMINQGEKKSPQVSLFVKKDFAQKNRRLLIQLITMIEKKTTTVKQDPARMAAQYAPLFQLKPMIIEQGLKKILMEIPDYQASKSLCHQYLHLTGSNLKLNENFYFKY